MTVPWRMTCQPTSMATAANATSPTTVAAVPDNGVCVTLTLWTVKPRLATVHPPELSPPAATEQGGASRQPQPQGDPDPGQAQPVETQHQDRQRNVTQDGQNHRAAHSDVVRDA